MTTAFSADLPDDCPLPSARDCDCEVFFLVQDLPPREEQFLSQAERGRATLATGDAACRRHGLSVFPNVESCRHQLDLFPRLGPHIIRSELSAAHGKIASTPSQNNPAHMTWWRYIGIEPHKIFSVWEE